MVAIYGADVAMHIQMSKSAREQITNWAKKLHVYRDLQHQIK